MQLSHFASKEEGQSEKEVFFGIGNIKFTLTFQNS